MMMVAIKEKETDKVVKKIICEGLFHAWKVAESINNDNQNYYAEVFGYCSR
jgi:uncharacterized FlaG/YvyC family protein